MTARALVLTYIALLVLAAASWLFAEMSSGVGVALAIAAAKTILIVLVFMELAEGQPSDRMIALAAAFFVLLMTFGVLADVTLR
jgi:caa(3)-type oxidase subunit IV